MPMTVSPRPHAEVESAYRILRLVDGEWVGVDTPRMTDNIHHHARLAGRGWMLVRARAENEDDANAHVLDAGGALVRSVHVGDGVEMMQVDAASRIWLCFMDEGAMGTTSLGREGLIAIDEHGADVFRYSSLGHEQGISDLFRHQCG